MTPVETSIPISYDTVVLNVGDGFDASGTTTFTAPVSGVYNFHYAHASRLATVRLNVNGVIAQETVNALISTYPPVGSNSYIVQLIAGDLVTVDLFGDSAAELHCGSGAGNLECHFGGFLLYQDI